MATRYNDIVTLRQMRPAYNIKEEAPDDWKTFIANDLFNSLLKKTVAAVRNNDQDKHRSIWIAGTYGSGKSHAGSVLKHLLCDQIENVEEFVNDEYREEKYAMLKNSVLELRREKRLFPVNLYGQQYISREADLSLQIQKEVKNALSREGIDITVPTDFQSYVSHIDAQPGFWEMLISQNELLKSVAPDIEKLRKRLNECDTEVFSRVNEALSEGGYTINLQNNVLPQWLEEVQNELRTKNLGYSGLLLIWDEFTEIGTSDLALRLFTLLQEVEETLNKVENDSYFLYISHPSVFSKLDNEAMNKTMGRYNYVVYNMAPVSAYRIMSKKFKIVHFGLYDRRQDEFCEQHRELIEAFSSSSTDPQQTFRDLSNLFPLHPATANLATYFAIAAGSSSRSVFDFLASDGVKAFFDSEEAYSERRVITADYLWDYVQSFFEERTQEYGAVTERFNSHHLAVEAEGEDTLAVFKGILLLNALNNRANDDTVTPSQENIALLFEGTPIYDRLIEILDWFNDKSIIQRQPNGNFSILFTALPPDEILKIKEDLRTSTYQSTEQVAKFNRSGFTMMNYFTSQVFRPMNCDFLSLSSNEYTLLNKVESLRRHTSGHQICVAYFVGKTEQELAELKAIAAKSTTDERFQSVCFVVLDTALGEKNYERFIEYQANATCAQRHSLVNQTQTYTKNSGEIIAEWFARIRSGNVMFFINGRQIAANGNRLTSTFNMEVSPLIFTSGPESLPSILDKKSTTYWKEQSAKLAVQAILNFNSKSEVLSKLNAQYKHVELLLQDSVDENLNWKSDCDENHPLKLVSDFVRNVFAHTNKNQSFNLGEKLHGLTEPPFGLFKTIAPMAMVAFALRPYIDKIYLNGKPRSSQHLVDDVVELFDAWSKDKVSSKLEFELESREAGQLSKLLVSVFGLTKLKGDIEISSLKDARWTMQHEYVQAVGYPLWSLKYATDDEELKKVIADIVEVINEAESVKKPQLMASAVTGLSQRRTDLGNMLLQQADSFRKGFVAYLFSLDRIALKEEEIDNAYIYLKEHLAGTNSLWSEEQVEDSLRDMREEELRRRNEELERRERERQRQNGGNPFGSSVHDDADSTYTPHVEESVVLEKRQKAKRVLAMASSGILKELLTDLCENADVRTLDIIIKYV